MDSRVRYVVVGDSYVGGGDAHNIYDSGILDFGSEENRDRILNNEDAKALLIDFLADVYQGGLRMDAVQFVRFGDEIDQLSGEGVVDEWGDRVRSELSESEQSREPARTLGFLLDSGSRRFIGVPPGKAGADVACAPYGSSSPTVPPGVSVRLDLVASDELVSRIEARLADDDVFGLSVMTGAELSMDPRLIAQSLGWDDFASALEVMDVTDSHLLRMFDAGVASRNEAILMGLEPQKGKPAKNSPEDL